MEVISIAPALRLLDWFGGEKIRWFRYVGPCPCSNPQKKTVDRTHALCAGTGLLKEEINVSGYQAIISNVTASKQYTGIGELEAGDLMCATWPNEIPLSKLDEVIVLSRSRVDSVVLKRGSGVDPILSPSNAVIATTLEVQRIFDINGPVTSGWALQTGGIAWEAGSGPALGEQYTVRYRYQPIWEVLDAGILARKPDPGGEPLPQMVGLKIMAVVR